MAARRAAFPVLCWLFAVVAPPSGMQGLAVDAAPQAIVLWPQGAPGALGKEEADIPTLTPFLAPPGKATGAAVIVCPGGGYHHLAAIHQQPVAEWLNSLGVAGFVLKYRHLRYKHPAPFEDAARAIRTVRARAAEWKLDPRRIGIMGFSAGGHLAAMTGTRFDAGRPNAADPIERASSRPDLMILSVAVITMRAPHAHSGSVMNLLGEKPDPKLLAFCSCDEQVIKETPPAFIVASWSDTTVPIENSLRFAAALRRAGVPCEMHVYEQGPHNFLLAQGETRRILDTWWDRSADWLRLHGFAGRTERFERITQRLTQAINAQDHSAIRQDFSQAMLDDLTVDRSKQFFTDLLDQFGKIERLDSPRLTAPNRAVVSAHCARQDLEITIVLDAHDRIAGLSFLPPATQAVPVPERLVTSFHLPFEGRWLVFWGGDSRELNRHHDAPNQRFAFDFVVVDAAGRSCKGEGKENKDYYAFGQPVLAPADGLVTDVVTGVRDNTPGSVNPSWSGGNAVILRHREHEVSVLAHFQQDSIRVKRGDQVKRGQALGLCGNSGNSSEPHIHFHVQNTAVVQNGTGLRCVFDKITVTRNGRTESKASYSPVKGDIVGQQ